jgi:hypothetical protein
MAAWDDVRRLALALAEADERVSRGNRQWRVKDKLFVWERPLRAKEVAELGAAAPDGPVLGARVEHLDRIALDELEEIITEAWLARAPTRLVQAFLAERD